MLLLLHLLGGLIRWCDFKTAIVNRDPIHNCCYISYHIKHSSYPFMFLSVTLTDIIMPSWRFQNGPTARKNQFFGICLFLLHRTHNMNISSWMCALLLCWKGWWWKCFISYFPDGNDGAEFQSGQLHRSLIHLDSDLDFRQSVSEISWKFVDIDIKNLWRFTRVRLIFNGLTLNFRPLAVGAELLPMKKDASTNVSNWIMNQRKTSMFLKHLGSTYFLFWGFMLGIEKLIAELLP